MRPTPQQVRVWGLMLLCFSANLVPMLHAMQFFRPFFEGEIVAGVLQDRNVNATLRRLRFVIFMRHAVHTATPLVSRQPTETEQMNASGSPPAKAPMSPLMHSPLLLHAAAGTLEGLAQSLLAPLASYLTVRIRS